MAGSDTPTGHQQSARAFWIGIALGLPIIGIGVRGVLANSADAHPAELGRWIAGSAMLHDAVVIPLVAVTAVVGRRFVPSWAWPPVRWGLFSTAVLVVVSRPFVAGYGYNPANPTALSRDYGTGLLVALGLLWLAVAAWAAVEHRGR